MCKRFIGGSAFERINGRKQDHEAGLIPVNGEGRKLDRNNLNYSAVLRNFGRTEGSSLLTVTCWKSLVSGRNGPALGTLSHWLGTAHGTNKCLGGSRGPASGAVSQLCSLQQEI